MDILDRSFTANESLEAKQYHYVKIVAAKTVGPITSADDKPIGILQNHPPSGGVAKVRMLGESKLKASDVVSAGADVGTADDGRGVTKSTGGDFVPSRAISAAPSATGLFDVTVNTLSLATVPA